MDKATADKSLDSFLAALDPDQNWELVEFRCMVQDILGNEIYSKSQNPEKFGDRTIFYCITVPGENDWVRASPNHEFMSVEVAPHEMNNRVGLSLVNWSYPIPDGKNKSCLIKVYDPSIVEYLRVNDIVQVSGVVEPNNDSENEAPESEDTDDYEPTIDLPHRLVPRVHVKQLKKLNHINPLLPEIITRDIIDLNTIKLARARMSTILTQLFGGDSLTADYLMLSLISSIHKRKDVSTLGQLTIGISGVKPQMKFLIDKLYEIISKITTHSHFIDLSIANLNNLRFTPKKDDDKNKMIAGTLQLPDGLYLVLNELALQEGQLTTQGTENLDTLNQIIRWQRHNYNFTFHKVEIDTDLKVLVVSEGKSILTVPYNVPIAKHDPETIESMREACNAVNDFLTEELLNMFRYFVTALKDVPEYDIPDEVQKCIQEDFASWRKDQGSNSKTLFSADDLSSYLTLARYQTISRGQTLLTKEIWKETCQMETSRKARIRRSIR